MFIWATEKANEMDGWAVLLAVQQGSKCTQLDDNVPSATEIFKRLTDANHASKKEEKE